MHPEAFEFTIKMIPGYTFKIIMDVDGCIMVDVHCDATRSVSEIWSASRSYQDNYKRLPGELEKYVSLKLTEAQEARVRVVANGLTRLPNDEMKILEARTIVVRGILTNTRRYFYKVLKEYLNQYYKPDLVAMHARTTCGMKWLVWLKENYPHLYADLDKQPINRALCGCLNETTKHRIEVNGAKNWLDFTGHQLSTSVKRRLLALKTLGNEPLERLAQWLEAQPKDNNKAGVLLDIMLDLPQHFLKKCIKDGIVPRGIVAMSLMTKKELRAMHLPGSMIYTHLSDGMYAWRVNGHDYSGLKDLTRNQVLQWHHDMMQQRRVVYKDHTSSLPSGPLQDDKFDLVRHGLVHLNTVEALQEEGKTMHHCVGGFAHAVARCEVYVYHFEDEDGKATIAIRQDGQVEQCFGPCNQVNKTSIICVTLVKAALEAYVRQHADAYSIMRQAGVQHA